MTGKIIATGFLQIVRGKDFKEQCCPYGDSPDGNIHCGDWCALFGEPMEIDLFRKSDARHLQLCRERVLNFDKLEDLRAKQL